MKKSLLLLGLCCSTLFAMAKEATPLPLPNGATAPNFTLTDLDGNTHTLYDYLDQGITVMIDFSATWCGPCWNYHNTHILNNLYNQYGPDGTGEVMVFFIEADPSTPVASLYGGSGSQGNWVAGTDYPIMDDGTGAVNAGFQVSYFPTLYAVCPNRKIYEAGQTSLNGWVNWINSCSLDATSSVEDAVCFGESSGSIDLSPSGGTGSLSYSWSNGANTPDAANLSPGVYSCTITEGQGHSIEIGPLQVGSPSLIAPNTVQQASPSCYGDGSGFALVSASGGVPPYTYQWSNGGSGPMQNGLDGGAYQVTVTDANNCEVLHGVTISEPPPLISGNQVTPELCSQQNGTLLVMTTGGTYPYYYDIGNGLTPNPFFANLTAGTYQVTVTDALGCQEFLSLDIPEEAPPTAAISPAPNLGCSQLEIVLDGSNSTQGNNMEYSWSTPDGNIVGSPEGQNVTVDAPGTYYLLVLNLSSGCQATTSVTVNTDFDTPLASVANPGILDCLTPEITLDGSGSSQGPEYAYQWTTATGSMVGPTNVLNPLVNAPGTYTLTVVNITNGCESVSEVTVESNIDLPMADAGADETLNCGLTEVMLDGTQSSFGPNITYSWSTAGGNIISGQNTSTPICNAPAVYILTVTNLDNGCTSSDEVLVTEDLIAPVANAGTSMVISCENPIVVLDGSASSVGANYSYLWVPLSGGSVVSGAGTLQPEVNTPGIYQLEVINNTNFCQSTSTVEVTEIPAMTASLASSTNIQCAGDATGSASILAAQGSGTYAYAWPGGGTGPSQNGLVAGIYAVTVSDESGCEEVVEVEITEPAALIPNAVSTNETSNGANDGTASVAPTGGTPGYSFQWSTGEPTASISNLAPGTYAVTITDGNGCVTVEEITVGAFSCAISTVVTGVDASCFGENNGEATVEISDGLGPYQIDWSDGQNGATVSGLSAGTYTVTVVDANNCPAQSTVVIAEPEALNILAVTNTSVLCYGESTGNATVEGLGGTPGYTFEWSTGASGETAENLAAGVYTVSLVDANGCLATEEVEVSEPDPITTTINAQGESALGANDGTAIAYPEGGTPEYTYLWSTGATEQVVLDLAPGTYSVEITDANGCTFTEEFDIPAFDCSGFDVSAIGAAPSCVGAADGQASALPDGGTGPFTYVWSNGESGSTIENLSAGTYSLTVTDGNNCPAEYSVTIEDPMPVAVEPVEIFHVECDGQTTGSAEVLATGGTGVFEYLWSNGTTGPVAENLEPGLYTVDVLDENGCSGTLEVEIEVGEDLTPPVILAQSTVLSLNAAGLAILDVAMLDQGSYDNCGLESLSIDQESFGCDQIGANEVLITAVDINGNSATQLVEVYVEAPPIELYTQNVVLSLDENGQASLTAETVDAGSTIACGTLSFALAQTQFQCDDLGMNEVQFIASDEYGNETSTLVQIEVIDNIAPIVTCLEDLEIYNCDGYLEYDAPVAIDNCSEVQVNLVEGLGSGANFPLGTSTEVYELVDQSGNTVSCSFTVTVINTLAVETEGTNSCANSNTGVAEVTAIFGGTGPYTYLWDNGETTPSILGLGEGEYGVTVTDATSCEIEAFVQVDLFPGIVLDDIQVTNTTAGQMTGSIDLSVSGGVFPYSYLWEDSNGNFVTGVQDPVGLGAGSYTVLITDAQGCTLVEDEIVVGSTTDVSKVLAGASWEVFPNPTSGTVYVRLDNLPVPMSVQMSVLDMHGRIRLLQSFAAATQHSLQWSAKDLAAGIYFVQLVVGDQVLTQKLIVE